MLQSLTFLHPGLHFTEPKVCLTESYAAGCLLKKQEIVPTMFNVNGL